MPTTSEMIEVMQAYERGEPIEYRCKIGSEGSWLPSTEPRWNFAVFYYRVALVKPSINWDHVADKFNYLFLDHWCKDYIVSATHPVLNNRSWHNWGTDAMRASGFKSFKPGTVTCEDSLVIRPGNWG